MLNTQVDLSPEEQRRQAAERRARLFPATKIERPEVSLLTLQFELTEMRKEIAALTAAVRSLAKQKAEKESSHRAARFLSVDDFLNVVAMHYKLKASKIANDGKIKSYVEAREVTIYLCRKYTTLSLRDIAEKMGGRHHSTMMHAARVIHNRLAAGDESLARRIDMIAKRVLGDEAEQ